MQFTLTAAAKSQSIHCFGRANIETDRKLKQYSAIVSNPLQLLSTGRMPELMEQLRSSFDVILVDSPPAGVVVDAVEIAKYCDGALIVVSYNRGKKQEIGDVKAAIEKTGCKVLGAVLNDVDFDAYSNRKYYYKSERYTYYYKNQYGAHGGKKTAQKK